LSFKLFFWLLEDLEKLQVLDKASVAKKAVARGVPVTLDLAPWL